MNFDEQAQQTTGYEAAGTERPKDRVEKVPEPTLLEAVEAAINYCAKAINTLEAKAVDARNDMCDLLTLKEELLNDKIPPSAQKFLFNHLEDNL